jgi:hypothetical protein
MNEVNIQAALCEEIEFWSTTTELIFLELAEELMHKGFTLEEAIGILKDAHDATDLEWEGCDGE